MNRDRSVSIRNITAHLINDKNTSTAETCIVFTGNPVVTTPGGSIGVMNFCFFENYLFSKKCFSIYEGTEHLKSLFYLFKHSGNAIIIFDPPYK